MKIVYVNKHYLPAIGVVENSMRLLATVSLSKRRKHSIGVNLI